MKKLIQIQFFILLIGTVFAWSNFARELFAWLNQEACTTGCSATGQVVNPFLTPCFYGAVFFTIAFVVSIMQMIGSRKLGSGGEDQPAPAVTNEPADNGASDKQN